MICSKSKTFVNLQFHEVSETFNTVYMYSSLSNQV